MKYLIISLSIYLIAHVSFGSDKGLEAYRIEQVLQANSRDEVRRVRETTDVLAEQRARCRRELESVHVPLACFQVLEQEVAMNLLSRQDALLASRQLEQVCKMRLEHTEVLDLAEIKGSAGAFGKGCSDELRQRLHELSYIEAERNPTSFFQRRHGLGKE